MLSNMQMCPSGHYYDKNRYSECPYCKPNTPAPAPGPSPLNVTVPLDQSAAPQPKPTPNMDKTVRLVEQKAGYDPVVGWLVCVKGEDKGRDFRLHDGNNFVGRGGDMDVVLHDLAVSAANHFCITYDRRHDRYFMSMGMGKEIVYVDDQPLTANALTVQRGTRVEVGDTVLVFIPLSREDVQWDWEK